MADHGFFAYSARALDGWRARRLKWRTQRIMESLPAGIRKDIGWPDVLSETGPELFAARRGGARR